MRSLFRSLFLLALIAGGAASANALPYSNNVTNGVYATEPVYGVPTPQTIEPDFKYNLYQAVNRLSGTTYTRNDNLHPLYVENPSYWKSGLQNVTINSYTVAAIGYSASNANTLSYFLQGSPEQTFPIIELPFDAYGWSNTGASWSTPYQSAIFDESAQANIGFSLFSRSFTPTVADNRYYSQAGLNQDLYDHLMVYNMSALQGTTLWLETADHKKYLHTFGPNTLLLGWEDIAYSGSTNTLGDEDYNDLLFLLDSEGINKYYPTDPDNPSSVPEPGAITLVLVGASGLWIMRRNKR